MKELQKYTSTDYWDYLRKEKFRRKILQAISPHLPGSLLRRHPWPRIFEHGGDAVQGVARWPGGEGGEGSLPGIELEEGQPNFDEEP